MSNKIRLPADQAYVAKLHNRHKSGKTRNVYRRFGRSQYNQGGFNTPPDWVCMSDEGFESDIRRYEKLYKRAYRNKLIKHKDDNKKTTEWIDPVHTEIDSAHIIETMENLIRKENLRLKRVKPEYLQRLVDDKGFVDEIRADRNKYLEPI